MRTSKVEEQRVEATTVKNVVLTAHFEGWDLTMTDIAAIRINGDETVYEFIFKNVPRGGTLQGATIHLGAFAQQRVPASAILSAGDNLTIYQPVSVSFKEPGE